MSVYFGNNQQYQQRSAISSIHFIHFFLISTDSKAEYIMKILKSIQFEKYNEKIIIKVHSKGFIKLSSYIQNT